ncbi:MAG TPA: hypothetical protein VGQ20_12870 [Acidimicrobiales bacterium]|jgi:hypothetical protein|nr:hypothetical protein [Acidimicrobiales bacterium]
MTSATTPAALTTRDLLAMPAADLDDLFRSSPAGPVPRGRGNGTALAATAYRVARPFARMTQLSAWQGKVFADDGTSLRNLVSPLGVRAIRAAVYEGTSRLDDRPCVVLDYSKTSWIARWVRDEIREVAPGLYLGVVFVRSRRVPIRFALDFASGVGGDRVE